jgi:glycopeptide antibiotics resistance protein
MYPFAVLPWLVPGLLIAAAIAVPASRPFARWLPADRRVAWLILTSFGLIVSATLTPLRGDLETTERWTGTCDLARIGLAPIEWLVRLSDTSLNVALFVPLGIGIGLVAARHARARLVVAAVLLPFVIEGIQLTVSVLDRGCQSADVVDNLSGLLVGLLIGWAIRWFSDRRSAR